MNSLHALSSEIDPCVQLKKPGSRLRQYWPILENAKLNCQFCKLHDLPIMENKKLPILVITKLTTFGNDKTCQFWMQSKLLVFKPKMETQFHMYNLACHYKRAGEFMPILESCL